MIAATNNINFVNPVNALCPFARGVNIFLLPGTGFDGGSTLYDLSGDMTHATLTDTVTWRNDSVPGVFNSLEFTGEDGSYVSHSGLSRITTSFNISMMAYSDQNQDNGGVPRLLDFFQSGTIYFAIGVGNSINNDNLIFYDSVVWVDTGYTFPHQEWVHLNFSYSNSRMVVHVNGEQVYSASQTINVNGTPFALCARQSNGAETWDGRVGGLVIHNRGLPASEAVAFYRDWLAGFPQFINRITSPVLLAPQSSGFPFIQYYAGSGVSL